MNIAARIVEIISGMPYEEFLQKRFFNPLGIVETTFWPTEAQIARLAGAYGPNEEKNDYARGGIGFLTKPYSDRVHRYPETAGGLFSTTHDILQYGLLLANDGELDGKRYLSHAAMDELRKEQTGRTKVRDHRQSRWLENWSGSKPPRPEPAKAGLQRLNISI